jgi:hypothetical protein
MVLSIMSALGSVRPTLPPKTSVDDVDAPAPASSR